MTNSISHPHWLSRLLLITAAVLVLTPLIYQLGMSFKNQREIFSQPIPPFVVPPSIDNYISVLSQVPLAQYFLNTLLFAGGVTLGQLAVALPAAFAFSYYRFRFQNVLMAFILLSLMVPFVVTYIPNYLLLARWKLLNTIQGMSLPMIGVSLGFGIFLLRQNFMSFPREVLEAASIDGANSWQILWRILTPANVAPLIAVAVYVLINTWNQFIWPLLVGGGDEGSYTLTVAIQLFYTNVEGGDSWGPLMAGSVLASLPTIIIFLFMREGILRTFTEGAVKG